MKCKICNSKYSTKHVKRCSKLPSHVCEKCAIGGKDGHQCDLYCPDARFPEIDTYPLGASVIGLSPTGEIRGTTEEFLPRAFNFVLCTVHKVELVLETLYKLKVSARFTLQGNETLTKTVYGWESWKMQHIRDAVKKLGRSIDFPVVPVFAYYLHSSLRVIESSVNLKLVGRKVLTLINDTTELVGLPDCYPPLTKIPKPANEKYSYFVGKWTMFYAPFLLGATYDLSFEVEAINFFYETGFLFPYRFVKIENLDVSSQCKFVIADTLYRTVRPVRADFFPPAQEYEWVVRKTPGKLYPPKITPADPFRKASLVGSFENQKNIRTNGKPANLHIDDYGTLETMTLFAKPKNMDLHTSVEVSNTPIPVRIYEQMQELPRYRDFLVSFDIINFTDETVEVELTSEIKGYTDKAIDTVNISLHGGSQSSRILKTQCPKLKRGVLGKIANATTATFYYKIAKKLNSKKTKVEEGTRTVRLLPQDMIVWVMKDPKGAAIYDLSKMLGAWITPSDSKGLLDRIRGQAKKFHPEGILEGEEVNAGLEHKTKQVKALYDYLNSKSGISYVNQPFSYDFGIGGQRVLTPERVLSSKGGNCIDLVVLFSSLMEGIGINPLILIMPNHAFLGWGYKHKTTEMGFLECTCLGVINQQTGKRYTFEEASVLAEETFKKNFILIGSENYLPIHSLTFSDKKAFIVDLEDVRREGIFRKE